MNKPEVWPLERLIAYPFGKAAIWTLDFLRATVTSMFPLREIPEKGMPPTGLETLLAVGGGVLIDRAKHWRATQSPMTKLFVIPSIWGSGAENSRIVVLNEGDKKAIFVGGEYLPDVRSVWPAIIEQIPSEFIVSACGDVWSHALEGFLSPVGTDESRSELADVIKGIMALSIGKDAAWFEFSARACAGQAAASVGLVHGIAHTLEGVLKVSHPERAIGHAALCSLFLWPVLSLNIKQSVKINEQFNAAGIDGAKVIEIVQSFYDGALFRELLPILEEYWRTILRDSSTRTNSVLIRPGYIEYFKTMDFS